MNNPSNKMKKEYVIGVSALVATLIVTFVAIQADWGAMFSSLSHPITTTNSDFVQAGPFQVAVNVEPGTPQVGENRIVILVRDQFGKPVSGAMVRAVGEMPAMGAMPAMRAQADIQESTAGVYEGDFDLPMAGSWPLAVDVATDAGHHVDLAFDMATGREGIQLTTATPSGDVAYYTCSMHPSVKSATPGTCPICGMNLVPVTREELQSGSVMVDEGRRQTIGVKTGEVIRAPFAVPIRLQGQITYDETRLSAISLRFNGWIGDLFADFEGKPVRKGDKLFTVYSPELLSLQEEYLESAKRSRQGLVNASRKRLTLWGLNNAQIDWLEKQGKAQDYVPLFAPNDGVVIQKNIVAGAAFSQGQTLLQIADLSSLWIETFAYEQDLPLIEPGMSASVRLTNIPGDEFTATVMQVDPFLGENTRTARVRLQVVNVDGKLKPGLFAQATLQSDFGEMLLIPKDAVLVSGEKRIVFKDIGEGRLKPVTVRTGYSDDEYVVVRKGLQEGDRIVTSGNFLIAAESKLKAGVDQW
ncbi:efflux RND transporter periplasmic adaptor subunit [Ketobacter sp.]